MGKIITDEKLIDELLERGVTEVIIKENLKKRMLNGDCLRIKLGIDPTGSVLHLGHAVVLRKLREFQDLGHQVIFLIGDFTARIGDPTGRSETRKMMTDEEIKENMQSYQEQAGMILDMKKVEVRYNSEWLADMSFQDVMRMASKITYSQMAQRADFKRRIKEDIDIGVNEFMYPAMQGYDSVELKADVEIGGTDQKFNLLMGRQLQKRYGQNPQDVITCPLLEGLDGVEKMSKSIGNYIALTEEPNSIYGKVMSLADSLIVRYFTLCTNMEENEIKKIESQLQDNDVNPRDIKMKLAYEITKINHGEEKAKEAERYFVKTIQKKEVPDNIPEIKLEKEESIVDVLVRAELASSKGDARRKIEQGGVSINGEIIKDFKYIINAARNGQVIKVGKRDFRKIIFS